jgi:flagellar biosynthesis protein FlhG
LVNIDQAEGLRRMLGGPKPRIFTVLSATPGEEKGAMLVNLGASLAQAGSDVLLVDACQTSPGIASRLDALHGVSLLQVARQERALDKAIQPMPQGFGLARLMHGSQAPALRDAELVERLSDAFSAMAALADIVMVDAELGKTVLFPIPALASSEIVVQVSSSPDAITSAYAIIKRLHGEFGRRPFNILVTGASETEAQAVFKNMAMTANRYLGVKLDLMGFVPQDEHLTRAARLGRAVVDAFPLAGASVAFRRLAGRFAVYTRSGTDFQGWSANGADLRL